MMPDVLSQKTGARNQGYKRNMVLEKKYGMSGKKKIVRNIACHFLRKDDV